MTTAPRWLEVARRYEGEGEVAGKGVNPVILGWINAHGRPDWTDDSTIAWCGFFCAGVFTEAGLGHVVPKEPGAARSWRTVGEAIAEPRVGAIVVMPRDDPANAAAAHVGIITAFTATHIEVLAGNQGNKVCVDTFVRNDLGHVYRWPVAEATPAELAARGSRIAAAAERQKRDATVSGTASGATQLPVPALSSQPSPLPQGGLRQAVDGALGDIGWLKTTWTKIIDFATFASIHWRWVALAVAAYFALRFLWDAHLIGRFRAEDHNTGHSPLKTPPASAASPAEVQP